MNLLETPVVLLVFRRPDVTRRVFQAVAAARPKRLLLVADGPRAGRPGEAEACEQVRKIVTAIDWPCEVDTNFAEENLGCRARVVSGLNWAFSRVEEAIILEDDCLPDQSFFPFCSELLSRYRDRPQIGFIAGSNPLQKSFALPYSYYFSQMAHIWGWATWRRSWQEYDDEMQSWPAVKEAGLLHHLLSDERVYNYWTRIFDKMYDNTGPNTWDYRWVYTWWTRNWINIVPRRNLVHNIGFGADATHTTTAPFGQDVASDQMAFPLEHPPAITSWPAHLRETQRRLFVPRIHERLRRKILQKLGSRRQEDVSA